MASPFLVDTDVVIDYLREFPAAVVWWEALAEQPNISAITVGELYAGVRDGSERQTLELFVTISPIINVDIKIAEAAGLHVRQYRKSHGVLIPDAMIASTAESVGAQLVTLNRKHYPMAANILVPYTK